MDSVVSGEIHLAAITHKPARDALRQAAEMAAQGDPVWIVDRTGSRIAAIVSVERAQARVLRPVDESEDVW